MATWGMPMTTWTGVQGWQRPQLPRHVGGEEPTNNLLLMCAYVAPRGRRSPTAAAARLVDDAGSSWSCCCCCFFSFQIVKVGPALRIAVCCRYVRTQERRGQESLLEAIRRWSRFHTTGLMSAALHRLLHYEFWNLLIKPAEEEENCSTCCNWWEMTLCFIILLFSCAVAAATNLRKFVDWVSTESYSQADQQLSAAFSRYKLHT